MNDWAMEWDEEVREMWLKMGTFNYGQILFEQDA